jgi:hypothetical protein
VGFVVAVVVVAAVQNKIEVLLLVLVVVVIQRIYFQANHPRLWYNHKLFQHMFVLHSISRQSVTSELCIGHSSL